MLIQNKWARIDLLKVQLLKGANCLLKVWTLFFKLVSKWEYGAGSMFSSMFIATSYISQLILHSRLLQGHTRVLYTKFPIAS